MHKFTLAFLLAVAAFLVSAPASAAQGPRDQGGAITPGVGVDEIGVPQSGVRTKSKKSNP